MCGSGQITAGVEVGALGSPAPGEREVGCSLRGAVLIASVSPTLSEGAVVLDVETARHTVWVCAQRGEPIAGEMLDLVDLDGELLRWQDKVETGLEPDRFDASSCSSPCS